MSRSARGGEPRDPLRRIGEELVDYVDSGVTSSPPYYAYVYSPRDEFAVRQELQRLADWLRARNVSPASISLAKLLWQAIDDSGYREQIEREEIAADGEASVLERLSIDINQILMSPPTLADRVIMAVERFDERAVAFLYRAGALYPTFRTSALLDDLRERLERPVVLLYPGRLVGSYGLSFMGKCEPAHGYRARIVAREAR